jgi:poly(hydroxyalkanoate) granule-associated protein
MLNRVFVSIFRFRFHFIVTLTSGGLMVKKLQKSKTTSQAHTATGAQLASSVKDSAQQIWLAGLGAFSKAQAEGGKVFETLVKDGMGLQRKTQAAAEEKISEATSKMTNMANGITAKATGVATDITAKATGQWDKLENIFEERVAKALSKLGMPTAKEVQALAKRVDELSAKLNKTAPKPATASKVVVKAVAKKAVAAKKVAKTATKRAPASK